MKQFLTVLVAALFAAASVTAIAQPKAEKMPKKEMTAEEKDKVKAKAAKSKTAKKKKKAAEASAAKASQKDEVKK